MSIIGGSFGVGGTIFGVFIGWLYPEHRLAIERIKENIRITEFNKAAKVTVISAIITACATLFVGALGYFLGVMACL